MAARTCSSRNERHGSNTKSTAKSSQPSRYPASFEAGNHRSTDVRHQAADRNGNDEAPQLPKQVCGNECAGGSHDRLEEHPGRAEVIAGGHGSGFFS